MECTVALNSVNKFIPLRRIVNGQGEDVKFSEVKEIIMEVFPELRGKSFSLEYKNFWSELIEICDDFGLHAVANMPGVNNKKLVVKIDEKNIAPNTKSIHSTTMCDECGMDPVVGIRYKCSVQYDYDVCEICEPKKIREFPMLKITTPEQFAKLNARNASSQLSADCGHSSNLKDVAHGVREKKDISSEHQQAEDVQCGGVKNECDEMSGEELLAFCVDTSLLASGLDHKMLSRAIDKKIDERLALLEKNVAGRFQPSGVNNSEVWYKDHSCCDENNEEEVEVAEAEDEEECSEDDEEECGDDGDEEECSDDDEEECSDDDDEECWERHDLITATWMSTPEGQHQENSIFSSEIVDLTGDNNEQDALQVVDPLTSLWAEQLEALRDMGFVDYGVMIPTLERHVGTPDAVCSELLELVINDLLNRAAVKTEAAGESAEMSTSVEPTGQENSSTEKADLNEDWVQQALSELEELEGYDSDDQLFVRNALSMVDCGHAEVYEDLKRVAQINPALLDNAKIVHYSSVYTLSKDNVRALTSDGAHSSMQHETRQRLESVAEEHTSITKDVVTTDSGLLGDGSNFPQVTFSAVEGSAGNDLAVVNQGRTLAEIFRSATTYSLSTEEFNRAMLSSSSSAESSPTPATRKRLEAAEAEQHHLFGNVSSFQPVSCSAADSDPDGNTLAVVECGRAELCEDEKLVDRKDHAFLSEFPRSTAPHALSREEFNALLNDINAESSQVSAPIRQRVDLMSVEHMMRDAQDHLANNSEILDGVSSFQPVSYSAADYYSGDEVNSLPSDSTESSPEHVARKRLESVAEEQQEPHLLEVIVPLLAGGDTLSGSDDTGCSDYVTVHKPAAQLSTEDLPTTTAEDPLQAKWQWELSLLSSVGFTDTANLVGLLEEYVTCPKGTSNWPLENTQREMQQLMAKLLLK